MFLKLQVYLVQLKHHGVKLDREACESIQCGLCRHPVKGEPWNDSCVGIEEAASCLGKEEANCYRFGGPSDRGGCRGDLVMSAQEAGVLTGSCPLQALWLASSFPWLRCQGVNVWRGLEGWSSFQRIVHIHLFLKNASCFSPVLLYRNIFSQCLKLWREIEPKTQKNDRHILGEFMT